MKHLKWMRFWSVAVGAMDAVTGALLIFAPALVLGLLGIGTPSADALQFLSWIGVFVMAVGLSYGLALGEPRRGEAVWIFTALVRMMVAVFLTGKILSGTMAPAWLMVAASDGAVALVQLAILRAGWWREGGT